MMRVQSLCFFAAAAFVLSSQQVSAYESYTKAKSGLPPVHVDCGGHFAETCSVCTQGHGALWCNGDCTYVFSTCKYTTPWVQFEKLLSDIYDWIVMSLWYWCYYFPVWLLFALLMFIYACIYRGKVVTKFPTAEEGGIESVPAEAPAEEGEEAEEKEPLAQREVGLFACFGAPNQCLWATFCTPVLAAKNFDVSTVCVYWGACGIMFLMYTPLCCCAILMHTIMAVRLQRNLKQETTFGLECLTSCCCMPCAVGREAIEVDAASKREVKCLFTVNEIEEEEEDGGFFGGGDKKKKSWRERCCAPSGKKDKKKEEEEKADEAAE